MNHEVVDQSPALSSSELQAFHSIISALNPLPNETRRRLLESAATLLSSEQSPRPYAANVPTPTATPSSWRSAAPFSTDTEMSPKDFLFAKGPQTDVERIACLAYYLTHYRAAPHFKTVDLSLLNTEAAQPKFANTSVSSNNAVKLGYLVSSTKGQRQLSAVGERFVRALPDRDSAKEALASLRKRSRVKKSRGITISKSES